MSKAQKKLIYRLPDGSYVSHDQIIHFIGGEKFTVCGVKWIWENEMLHLVNENEIEFIINKKNVLFVQRRVNYGVNTK